MDPNVGRVIAGRYRITERIGGGGMGVVYAAVQEGLSRDVAVKLMRADDLGDAAAVERFTNEARAAAQLAHPHIVTVHDFGSDGDGTFFLVMERIVGTDLRALIARGPMSFAESAQCARQIAAGLAAAHRAGTVHRDLKPANVMVIDDAGARALKILDFGLAKRTHKEGESLTKTGDLVGTPGYVSPEQVNGERGDARSDLYALGVIWYELVTGANPFTAESSLHTLLAHLDVVPPPASSSGRAVPPEADALIARLLAKDPPRRPASAELLVHEIDALTVPRDGSVSGDASGPHATRRTTRPNLKSTKNARPQSAVPLLAISVLTIAALVILVALLATRQEPALRARGPAVIPSSALSPLPPPPAPENPALVDIGRLLYQDPILSVNKSVSCATCHPLPAGGTTPEGQTILGVNQQRAPFNTPTIFNASLGYKQGWRADAETIADILERPLFKPMLMGNKDWAQVRERLADTRYPALFKEKGIEMYDATGKGVGITAALEAYVHVLTPRGAPADDKFGGVENALQGDAAEGFDLFKDLGCVACHQGRGVGGNMVARFGALVEDPYADRGQCTVSGAYCRSDSDCGGTACDRTKHGVRLEDYGQDATAATTAADATYRFRVPSLRNVAKTPPYFHDGSVRELPEAVRTMARLQLGRELSSDETRNIVAFLESLTGKVPEAEINQAQDAADDLQDERDRKGPK